MVEEARKWQSSLGRGVIIGFYVLAGVSFLAMAVVPFNIVHKTDGSHTVTIIHHWILKSILVSSVTFMALLSVIAIGSLLGRYIFKSTLLPSPGRTWGIFFLGLVLFVVTSFVALRRGFSGSWGIPRDPLSIKAPDHSVYYLMHYTGFIAYEEGLARQAGKSWYGDHFEMLATNEHCQDYSPQGRQIVLPVNFSANGTQLIAWNGWILYMESSDYRQKSCSMVWLAYNTTTRKGYGEHCAPEYYPGEKCIQELSPFILIGPDTPIKEPEKYVECVAEAAQYVGEGHKYGEGWPKPEAVLPDLKHPNPEVRSLAQSLLVRMEIEKKKDSFRRSINKLVEAHDSKSVDALIGFLTSPDPEVRLNAVISLGKCKDQRAIRPLLLLLEDPDPSVSRRAEEVIDELVDSRSIDLLNASLKEATPSVQLKIFLLLSKFGDRSRIVEPLLHFLRNVKNTTIRQKGLNILIKLKDPQSLEILVQSIQSEDPVEQQLAADGLINLGGNEVVDALIKVLKTPEVFSRVIAAKTLGKLKDKRVVEPLVEAMDDPKIGVREAAAESLVSIGGDEVVDASIRALKTSNGFSSIMAPYVLGKLREKRAVEPLIDALNHPKYAVRRSAARALGRIGDPRAMEPLKNLATSKNRRNSKAAIRALEAIQKKVLTTTQTCIDH